MTGSNDSATDAEELRRVLRARAVQLAAPPSDDTPGATLDAVVFRIGSQRYAIEASEALEAIQVNGITALPGIPAFYHGLISHQGVVYPLLDIRPLVAAPVDEQMQQLQAILFQSSERTIAIGADLVESFTRIDLASVAMTRAGDAQSEASPTLGLTNDGIVILDVNRLLADARLVVDDRPVISEQHARGAT